MGTYDARWRTISFNLCNFRFSLSESFWFFLNGVCHVVVVAQWKPNAMTCVLCYTTRLVATYIYIQWNAHGPIHGYCIRSAASYFVLFQVSASVVTTNAIQKTPQKKTETVRHTIKFLFRNFHRSKCKNTILSHSIWLKFTQISCPRSEWTSITERAKTEWMTKASTSNTPEMRGEKMSAGRTREVWRITKENVSSWRASGTDIVLRPGNVNF